MRLPTAIVAIVLLAISGVCYSQVPPPERNTIPLPIPLPIPELKPLIALPAMEQSVEQLLDSVEALRVQKALLEKQEKAILELLSKKFDKQSERISKLAIGSATPVESPSPILLHELYEFDELRNGKQTPFDKAESRGADLLKRYTGKHEQGLIYYELAHIYSQSGVQHPDRIKKYVKLALDRLENPAKRASSWGYLSSAIEVDTTNPKFEERRREATQACLNGIKELLTLKLPDTLPEFPFIDRLSYTERNDPEAVAKRAKLWEEREQAKK